MYTITTPEPSAPPSPKETVKAFYEAFDVQPGDGLYLPPEERVSIW